MKLLAVKGIFFIFVSKCILSHHLISAGVFLKKYIFALYLYFLPRISFIRKTSNVHYLYLPKFSLFLSRYISLSFSYWSKNDLDGLYFIHPFSLPSNTFYKTLSQFDHDKFWLTKSVWGYIFDKVNYILRLIVW